MMLGIPPVAIDPAWFPIQVYTQVNDPGDGMPQFTGVILAHRFVPKGFDDYATWLLNWDPRLGRWVTVSGNYMSEIDKARYDFGHRLLRNCWGATVRGIRDAG